MEEKDLQQIQESINKISNVLNEFENNATFLQKKLDQSVGYVVSEFENQKETPNGKIINLLYASEISTFLKNYHQISDEIRTFKSYAKNLAKKTNDDKKSLDV